MDKSSIPEQSRRQLNELFRDATLEKQWFTIVPKHKAATECAPSNSDQHFMKIYGCQNEVKEFLGKAFDNIFAKKGHVASFWEDFEMSITHKLGLTYRELACQSNGKLEKYSEAQLQQMVLNPLIRELSKAVSIIPNISDETIKTDFFVQDEVEIIGDQPGQKPTVDALIQISDFKTDDGKNRVIACIPIEMKVDMDIKHYSQIACYINKLSTVEELANFVMIGIIIDKKQFRLAFSVYCNGKTPLPIVYISPPTEWRSELSCTIDQKAMLTLACTFLTGQLERLQYSEKSCDKISTDELIEWGKLLEKNRHELGKPEKQRVHLLSLQRTLEVQEKSLKKHEEKIAAQESKIEKQEKKIEEQETKIKELLKTLDDKIPKPKCKRLKRK